MASFYSSGSSNPASSDAAPGMGLQISVEPPSSVVPEVEARGNEEISRGMSSVLLPSASVLVPAQTFDDRLQLLVEERCREFNR